MDDKKERIKNFLKNKFRGGRKDIDPGRSLFGDGTIDSFSLMEVIAFVEKEFGVSVTMSEVTVDNFDTVNNICSLVERKLSGQKGSS